MKNDKKGQWTSSDENLPDVSLPFTGKDVSVPVLIWHKPTNKPFVGEFVRERNGAEYFTDMDLWRIELKDCPFWMHIPAYPTNK